MVIEEHGLVIDNDVHFKRDMLKAVHHLGTQVGDVVITHDQHNPPVELVKNLIPCGCVAKDEVAQVEHQVILANYTVPVANQRLVHLFDTFEGTVAVAQDACVIEMGVRREEHLLPRERVPGFHFVGLLQDHADSV